MSAVQKQTDSQSNEEKDFLTWILLKYCQASKGTTLYVEIPVIGSSVGFVAV